MQDATKRTGGEDAIKRQLESRAANSAALAEQLNRAQLTKELRLPEALAEVREKRDTLQKQRDTAANTHKKAIDQQNTLNSKSASAHAVLEGEIKRTGRRCASQEV